jgi:1,4-dihydroxy-2-naphthoyl-CoA hydrolase
MAKRRDAAAGEAVQGCRERGDRVSIWQRNFSAEAFEAAHADTLPGLLGLRLVEIGSDFLRADMPVDARHVQPYGILHGGGSVVLAETLGSFAGVMAAPPDHGVVGVEVNANHLAPVRKGDHVTAICRPVRLGRTLQVWAIEIRRGDGTLTCVSRLTAAVQPARAGMATDRPE